MKSLLKSANEAFHVLTNHANLTQLIQHCWHRCSIMCYKFDRNCVEDIGFNALPTEQRKKKALQLL